MADWYASSAAYAAIAPFAISTAYTVGQFVKPTAPAAGKEYVFRVTTAGTSAGTEPTWSSATGDNATITSGGVTFTNTSAQSAYGWSAAAGTLASISNANSNRIAVGDRVFLSSDHSEAFTSLVIYWFNGFVNAWGVVQIFSVNRAGSVPPAAGDAQSGAVLSNSVGMALNNLCNSYWQGITFSITGSVASNLQFTDKVAYLKNCAISITNTNAGCQIKAGSNVKLVLDNTTLQFGNAGQFIASTGFDLTIIWLNTPAAFQGATVPTSLIGPGSYFVSLTARGVDLSALTTTLAASQTSSISRVLLDSCRIASGLTRLGAPGTTQAGLDEVELVNCYDGTNILSERTTYAGVVTTERTITLSGGATDDTGVFSHKMVSSTRADRRSMPLENFWFDIEQQAVGSSKTATVEIISSASLNNDDISLLLEYQGTSGSPVAGFGSTLPANAATPTAIATSTATWNSSPATPAKQKLEVVFTPLVAGRVRGLVRLGKPSTTVYVNPVIAIA